MGQLHTTKPGIFKLSRLEGVPVFMNIILVGHCIYETKCSTSSASWRLILILDNLEHLFWGSIGLGRLQG